MKKMLYTALLLTTTLVQAQDYFSFYIPLHTTHYTSYQDEPYHDGYLGSQGGQGGVIASYNKEKYKGIKSYTIGISQNSFGDVVGVLSAGRHYGKRFKYGYEYGITYGYGKSYKRNYKRLIEADANMKTGFIADMWDFTRETSLGPIITGVVSYMITDNVGVKALINPVYVNLGLTFKI